MFLSFDTGCLNLCYKQMFENGWLCVMIFATNYLKIDILCLCSKLQLNTNFTVFGKRMRKIFETNEFIKN